MIQGYKVTTYTISAHKGLQKNLQLPGRKKILQGEYSHGHHLWGRLDQLRVWPPDSFSWGSKQRS